MMSRRAVEKEPRNKGSIACRQNSCEKLPEKLTNLSMAWIHNMVPPFVDAEMPGDGWCSHKYDLCNQQQHGEQAPVVKIVDSAIR